MTALTGFLGKHPISRGVGCPLTYRTWLFRNDTSAPKGVAVSGRDDFKLASINAFTLATPWSSMRKALREQEFIDAC